MSGFLKRTKAVDTVNPAGGVNPAASPNVGQYGWTSYDAANVNQLIQYVNMAAASAEEAKESADYVVGKFGELKAFIDYIEVVYEKLKPIADNIEIIYVDITKKHKEINDWYLEIKDIYVDVVVLEKSAKASATEALSSKEAASTSAGNAKVSETNADKSAKDAADIAEELRKGQVYRGAWNLEENNALPPKPDTNSVWDVTLKEDSIQFVFAGETWYWGDRLLYLKDEDKFSQIESGSTVVSVNGKNGAVTLTATDVGALSLEVPPMTTPPSGFVVGQIASGNTIGAPVSGSQGFILKGGTGDSYEGALAWGYNSGVFSLGQKGAGQPWSWYRVYHEGFKPTATDVGAVPTSRKVNNKTLDYDVSLTATDVGAYTTSESNAKMANLVPKVTTVNKKPLDSDITLTATDVGAYSKGEVDSEISKLVPKTTTINTKPLSSNVVLTANDVNALPFVKGPVGTLGGGFVVGQIASGNTIGAPVSGSQAFILKGDTAKNDYEGALVWGYNSGVFSLGQKSEGQPWSWYRVYHEGFKPTATDVGAYDKAGADTKFVPKTTTVNTKPLSGNISLTATDVGALPITGGTITGPITTNLPLVAVQGVSSSTTIRINAASPMFECHSPGKVAFAMYAEPANSTYRVGVTNGSGSVSSVCMSMNTAGSATFTGNLYTGGGGGYLRTTGLTGGSVYGASGDVVAWATASFAPISDKNLKRNIKPATKSALEDVAKIDFVSYDWDETNPITKDKKSPRIGLTAQQMESIDPCYSKDIETFKADGSVETSVKSLDVTNILVLALKANQELLEELKLVKERLFVLESK